ncbi:hypothetical protein GCM10009122_40490 [Fulvivirga kasyanovii]|uniref:DUF1579 domain-containing protein n=1 Tax=Fulvivirga kasyanovii TaxID=396812 RepID=A0ABW9RJU6_9BACT|nr:hypothetical protein [Fulvivirga kasyanovii]MTI23688.1 hypothetical protein [Fulvivirga kasyanovii]
MTRDILGGTWKGSLILPGHLTVTSKERITDFFFRVRYDANTGTFSGIFMLNPDSSEIHEHAVMTGELSASSEITFEIRYSKFYFYTDQTEKEVASLSENILTKIRFKGSINRNEMLFGFWESDSSLFEYKGQVRKTLPRNGTWWAKRQSASDIK